MAAYVIGAITVHHTDWQKEYGEKMPALIAQYGGKILSKAAAHTLEGEARLPGNVIIVEFPNEEQVRGWYADPAHTPLKQLRRSGAEVDLLLVPGL